MSDTGIWHVITWHLILTPNIWHLTIDMLSLGTIHLTWCCDTWLNTITPDTYIILPIHDYHFYGNLAWLLYYYQTFGAPELLCSWTPVFPNPCNRETPDTILMLIPVIDQSWILGYCEFTVDIITGQSIIKYPTYTIAGETDGYRYYVIFIMMNISEVSCGARNDKSPEAGAISLKYRVGRVMISPQKQ